MSEKRSLVDTPGDASRDGSRAAPDSAPSEELVPYAWVILGIGLLVQCTGSFVSQAISPLAPFLQADLGLSRTQIGLLATAMILGGFLALPVAGRLGDELGERPVILGGLIGLAVTTGLAGLTRESWQLALCLCLSGIASSVTLPAMTRGIVFWFPPRVRSLAMGIRQTGAPLGGAVLGVTLPILATRLGWQSGFLALGLAGLVTIGVVLLGYREAAGERLSRVAHGRQPGRLRGLLRQPGLRWLLLVSLFSAWAQHSMLNFSVLYLQESFALSVIAAGGLLGVVQVGAVAGRIGWGVVSDRFFGGRRRIVLGLIGCCGVLTLLGLTRLPADAPVWTIGLLMAAVGATLLGWHGVSVTFFAEIAGRERSATASALSSMSITLGALIGPPTFGFIVDRTGSYTPALYSLIVVSLIALGFLLRVKTSE